MHSPSSASMRCRRPIARPCRQWGPAKPHIAAAGKRGAWATARSLWEDVLAQVDKAYYVAMLQLHAQHFLCEHLERTRAPAPSLPLVSIVRGALPLAPGSTSQGMAHRPRLCLRPSCTPAVFTTGKNARHVHLLYSPQEKMQPQAKTGKGQACALMCSIHCTACNAGSRHDICGAPHEIMLHAPPAPTDLNLVVLQLRIPSIPLWRAPRARRGV